jgi:uncharacterized protein YndB with AHSA1/START domain
MEQRTKVHSEPGKQELTITRSFDLPVELLFKAYVKAELVEQWMGTKVIKLETKRHGAWQFETTDPKGNKHGFHGVIHDIRENEKIIRTFEMENAPFGAQLEILEFQKTGDETSMLRMQVIYQSNAVRDQVLQLPFAQGINMAHNRLEEILKKMR